MNFFTALMRVPPKAAVLSIAIVFTICSSGRVCDHHFYLEGHFQKNICIIILSGALPIQTSVFDVWNNFHLLKRVSLLESQACKLHEHKHTGIITYAVQSNMLRLFSSL